MSGEAPTQRTSPHPGRSRISIMRCAIPAAQGGANAECRSACVSRCVWTRGGRGGWLTGALAATTPPHRPGAPESPRWSQDGHAGGGARGAGEDQEWRCSSFIFPNSLDAVHARRAQPVRSGHRALLEFSRLVARQVAFPQVFRLDSASIA